MPLSQQQLRSCHCCGLIQRLPSLSQGEYPVCARCATRLGHGNPRRNHWSAVLSASALAFYFPAMLLPLVRIERLGHMHEDSLLSGVATLWSEGYWLVGTVVLLFSVVLPPLKLVALFALSTRPVASRHRERALVYRLVERLGRWGMLDVLLVALLVAMVKLGDLVNIYPGQGLSAFIVLVLLSLLAGLVFNPQLMWKEAQELPR